MTPTKNDSPILTNPLLKSELDASLQRLTRKLVLIMVGFAIINIVAFALLTRL